MGMYRIAVRLLCVITLCSGFGAASAETPQQARQEIEQALVRSLTAYRHQDLPGFMALYSKNYTITNVSGRKQTYLQIQASAARGITQTRQYQDTYAVQTVSLQGSRGHSLLLWHTVYQQSAHLPRYKFVRDVTEDVYWVKDRSGWRKDSAQILRDTSTYLKT